MSELVTVFLDKDLNIDLDKVKIELPVEPGSGDPAKDQEEAQKDQDKAASDIQKALGGTDESKDATPPAKSDEDRALGDIEKALKADSEKK